MPAFDVILQGAPLTADDNFADSLLQNLVNVTQAAVTAVLP